MAYCWYADYYTRFTDPMSMSINTYALLRRFLPHRWAWIVLALWYALLILAILDCLSVPPGSIIYLDR